jgi:MFS family permease
MTEEIMVIACTIVVGIVSAVLYEYLPKRADGANAFFVACAGIACALAVGGVLIGFISNHTYLAWAIMMFMAAALLLALGIAGRRQIMKTSH